MWDIETDLPLPETHATRPVVRFSAEGEHFVEDACLCETPLALVYNGIAHTVMMGTPRDLVDFAMGFSLTEGIIDHHRDVHEIEVVPVCQGIELRLTLANRCVSRLSAQRRAMAGRTGCGICGTEKLDTVVRSLADLPHSALFPVMKVAQGFAQFQSQQTLNRLTGAAHAAAYLSAQGEILAVREDIGRHVALDKLIGHIHRQGWQGGAILITSRASFEMVQKTISAGVEGLFAISAVSDLAVQLADRHGLTLGGFCRNGRCSVYTHAHRMINAESV